MCSEPGLIAGGPLPRAGFECLESTAFNGISTNLVMYLETVLHGSNLASASNVTMWFGTSYLTPIFGAIIADAFWATTTPSSYPSPSTFLYVPCFLVHPNLTDLHSGKGH